MRLWNYAVKVADLEAATTFYVDALGGELRLAGRVLGSDYRALRLGDTRLFLFTKAPYEDQLEEPLPLGFLHVVFEVDDIAAEAARLREAGVTFLIEPQEIEAEFGRRRIAFFVAPDGARTEIMQIITDTGIA